MEREKELKNELNNMEISLARKQTIGSTKKKR